MLNQQTSIVKNNASERAAEHFRSFIESGLDQTPLERLHETIAADRLLSGTDQHTRVHRLVYQEFDKAMASPLVEDYYRLAMAMAAVHRQSTDIEDWAIQRYPSIRTHFPGNVSVFEFHRDSTYGHPLGEINHFMAVTACRQTAALWVEQTLGWRNYQPLNLQAAEVAVLNTSVFEHGDHVNAEGYTRVSIDFRLIPLSLVESNGMQTSITARKRFDASDYFISSRELERYGVF